MEPTKQSKSERSYLWLQLFFWANYFLLNLVFMGFWGANNKFSVILFVVLSILLGFASHGLRYLYKKYAQQFSLLRICLHLIWLIPAAAAGTQILLTSIMLIVVKVMPAVTQGVRPVGIAGLIGYTMNYAIMLTLWSIIYLLRAEFYQRKNSEVAYWQLQAKLKENELQFLRSQINSHFLFNAINNLRALVKEDAEAAREGLANLSTLLRGLLQADGQQLVTLAEELEWVKGYLALESLQFEQRLQTEIRVDQELLNAKVPPMLLQTLVENAIKHGIAARRNGGVLQIDVARLPTPDSAPLSNCASLSNDASESNCASLSNCTSLSKGWYIQVTNPPAEFHSGHQGNKIGLHNARERLRIAYGEKSSLSLQMGDDVIARAEIPF